VHDLGGREVLRRQRVRVHDQRRRHQQADNGSGDKVKVDSPAEVTFVSSYQTIARKSVFVTFEIKAKKKLTMKYDGAKYRGRTGGSRLRPARPDLRTSRRTRRRAGTSSSRARSPGVS
jgi:hypothetical protein